MNKIFEMIETFHRSFYDYATSIYLNIVYLGPILRTKRVWEDPFVSETKGGLRTTVGFPHKSPITLSNPRGHPF